MLYFLRASIGIVHWGDVQSCFVRTQLGKFIDADNFFIWAQMKKLSASMNLPSCVRTKQD